MSRNILYESTFARVVAVGNPYQKTTCVTFYTCATQEETLTSALGFGEVVLTRLGIPALHFINLQNHWWQIPDMTDCLQAANDWLENASERVGYGASMGAYAALNFSIPLKLDRILAFSPQYSIDPQKVPWEKRWRKAADKLQFNNDTMSIRAECEAHILYDPTMDDAKHADLICAAHLINKYEVAGVGHQCIKAFQDANLLIPLLKSFLSGKLNPCIISEVINRRTYATAVKEPRE